MWAYQCMPSCTRVQYLYVTYPDDSTHVCGPVQMSDWKQGNTEKLGTKTETRVKEERCLVIHNAWLCISHFVFQFVASNIHYSQPCVYLSQTRTVHAAMIQEDILNTSRTVPGQMVMRVFMTKRVLKLILLRAPMLRDEASVNSLLWSNMTLPIR